MRLFNRGQKKEESSTIDTYQELSSYVFGEWDADKFTSEVVGGGELISLPQRLAEEVENRDMAKMDELKTVYLESLGKLFILSLLEISIPNLVDDQTRTKYQMVVGTARNKIKSLVENDSEIRELVTKLKGEIILENLTQEDRTYIEDAYQTMGI